MAENILEGFSCPLPKMDYKTIQMAHGSGGKLSNELIEKVFLPCFSNQTLDKLEDQAELQMPAGRIAFSTDTFVVHPIFFPGGNIGELAINGTVNDLCMSGATPEYLSVGFILEEGLPIDTLHQIVLSMKKAAETAGVQIVTGDTKVVDKGNCDQIFINTSGIGLIPENIRIAAANMQSGDKIIISGTIADHGMAVMTSRENLSFQTQIKSDTAALNGLVRDMLEVSTAIHAMRDPTRGGLATTLNEFAMASQLGIKIYQDNVPVLPEVQGACELLGIDPLYTANEGKLVAVCAPDVAEQIVEKMRKNPHGKQAVIIGEVTESNAGLVVMQTPLGIERIIDMPIAEQLPRIC